MGFHKHWTWFAALLCLHYMGGEVWCNCTDSNMQIEGGYYTLTKNLQIGTMLVYHCPEGYYPYPALTRLCQRDSTWIPGPKRFLPQRCRLVECPDPNVLENGNVSPPQEKYFVSNETTYECYSGYKLRGSAKRTCGLNAKWTGSTPICSHDGGETCADPGIPAGATRSGHEFDIGDKVTYNCNGNLFLVGSKERICLENGQWTGIEPACYYRHTFDTPMEVSKAFGGSLKNSLTTHDPTDDTQEGRRIRVSKNGTLNIYIGVDISESISKENITSAKNAVKSLITKISSFAVTPNYDIRFFSSITYEVVNILDFLDGRETQSSLKTKIDNFEVNDEKTSGTDLNLVFETFLEQMALIKQRVQDDGFKEHRHVIIVFTDGAYNMGGPPLPTVAKIKNLVYMNQPPNGHVQPREDYLDIYIFGIGAEIYDDDLKPLVVGTGGKHYFRMQNIIGNLEETFDNIIDADEVVGLCGLHNATTGGTDKDGVKRKYPWVVSVIVKNGVKRSCLGSLVTRKFVLTAAHCFKFEDTPQHITVEIEKGGLSYKKVKKFTLHPNFNVNAKVNEGVKEFYDYDVALIELEVYVDNSDRVRHICIPCTVETRDALRLPHGSTCKDQEDLLFKTHKEKLHFLTKKDPLVAKKTIYAKLGDHWDACIRHALTAPGITTKNPKDAVTDNFLCTGGRGDHRDHIACSGDSGGAVFKDYVYRTIQVALVSWGTKNLCDGGMQESDDTSRDFHINLFRVVPFLKSVLGVEEQDDYAPLHFLD
ncbi:complement factor B-like [Scomber japonicus]|uniref:complement factor B-like n=1 Tax=Scomber japonicus TaxID=13676 RepID=UPI0023054D55|nr:complement factor B-like [Scomber japonicus]